MATTLLCHHRLHSSVEIFNFGWVYCRSWDKVYAAMRGTQLCFYKDAKAYKAAPEVYYKNDSPLELRGGSTQVAQDYTKKKYVFRVK